MTHSVALIVAETVRALSLSSPFHGALIRELGTERAAEAIARALDSLTPEQRRVALMAGAAGQAQLAADVIRHDAGGGYDRGAQLLGDAAGFLRQATGAYPSRVDGAEVVD